MSGCYCCWCCGGGGGGGGGCFFSNSGKILFVQFERKQINKILEHSIIEWRENHSILFSFYFQMKIWRWSAWFSFWIKSISSHYHIVLETTCVSHSATITVWLWVFISSIIHIFDAKQIEISFRCWVCVRLRGPFTNVNIKMSAQRNAQIKANEREGERESRGGGVPSVLV